MEPLLVMQIAELAKRLPGVQVHRLHESDRYCGIDLFIYDAHSLARLVSCDNAANIKTGILYAFWLRERKDWYDLGLVDPAMLIYRFGHKGEPHPPGTHSPMEIFGINLVHSLRACDLLEHDRGEMLKEKFTRA